MTINDDSKKASSLLDYLPALFQLDSEPEKPNFAGRFLLAFERLLLGLGEVSEEIPEPGLEEILAGGTIKISSETTVDLRGIERYFDPGYIASEAKLAEEHQRTPSDFLPWLASWLALTLREDWDDLRRSELVARAAQLYRLRGTKQGVEEFLRIYTRLGVRVDELNRPLQLGVHSTVGQDTILDGGAPFFFRVHILLATPDPKLIKEQKTIAQAIIDLQKPAHTHYQLFVDTPTFQIGVHSRVGTDTLLG